MPPRENSFKQVTDSNPSVPIHDMTRTKPETNSTLTSTTITATSSHENRIFSTKASVHKLLKCPICTTLMYPPIHQCPNGHTLCSNCKTQLRNTCPTCHSNLGHIRCLALEKIAVSLQLPCRYKTHGCHVTSPYYTNPIHELKCRFRPYNCPYAGSNCSITGDIPTLVQHLKEDHKVDMHCGSSFNHYYVQSFPFEVENAVWMLTVFNCFGRQFCLHFEAFRLGSALVYMGFVRFMGDNEEAKKFIYSLEVGGNGRKLISHGVLRSIRDSRRKVRDSQDGLIIHRNLVLYFSGGDQKELTLPVTGRIWKEEKRIENGHLIKAIRNFFQCPEI